jgi:SAM-dependent MidA family methyltransferase
VLKTEADDCAELRSLVAKRILEHPQQRVTFAEFMDWVLYEPEIGYYAAQRQKIGAGGDFVTSPHLGADFGELLAEQFLDLWQSLDRPSQFHLVEMGAGQGLIAKDVLRYLGDRAEQSSGQSPEGESSDYAAFWQALQYIVIEKSTALIREQQFLLKEFTPEKVIWQQWQDISAESIVGCCFSNELVDALPVHLIEVHEEQLYEVFVTVEADSSPQVSPRFKEVLSSPSTPRLENYLKRLEIDLTSYPNGYRSEIGLAALDWIGTVAQKLLRGYVLTIDYGHAAAQYYSLQRDRGTLQCYYQQAHHNDPYRNLGRQDLTAHVNFTALKQQGNRCGLEQIAFTQQALFLMALGLGDRIYHNTTGSDLAQILRRRDALHGLINPLGLGSFGILLQGKKTPASIDYSYKGFTE